MEHLMAENRYADAAALCPRVAGDAGAAWESWVTRFADINQIATLAPHLPTAPPVLLPVSTYGLALTSFLPLPVRSYPHPNPTPP